MSDIELNIPISSSLHLSINASRINLTTHAQTVFKSILHEKCFRFRKIPPTHPSYQHRLVPSVARPENTVISHSKTREDDRLPQKPSYLLASASKTPSTSHFYMEELLSKSTSIFQYFYFPSIRRRASNALHKFPTDR